MTVTSGARIQAVSFLRAAGSLALAGHREYLALFAAPRFYQGHEHWHKLVMKLAGSLVVDFRPW